MRDAGEAGAQLPRWLLRAAGQLPLPPARPRAGAAGSGVCGARIPRPRRRKSLCQELARRALPLRLGAGRAVAKSAPRAGRVLREGGSAGAGRERDMKGKQRGRWARLLFGRTP